MNSDIAEGKWRQMKGSVQEKWGKLTDDDVDQVEGNFEKFCGKMQERYGMSRDQAEKEFNRLKD
ncbi:MAG: general stress protein CsbD [Rheinheimera sp.]|uniref:CsbD family protein n=1 Tax=Arsukibacterium sp. UBA3155 TaxID=1946058 RepID=UPI000C8F168C|nr:CsbD family protein [Arsukibacterium sp. UBA3155]MAD76841.1 general stress protein CsbD [Rheinheimera sp.]|tara:strand:- start:25155 stop:25346 length:192 start_codon:yes stop_codon:yes gene_type:complete